jgi:hypothetical protein
VHLHRGQFGQDVRRLFEPHPVVLDVAASGEVSVAPVMAASDVGELAQLMAGQGAVGNRHPQHGRVTLHVEAVLQAQRAEAVLVETPVEKAGHLVAELHDPVVHQALVGLVVEVHG